MKQLGILTFLAITLLGLACSEATATTKPKKDFFFDIVGYIDSEIAQIDTTRIFTKKTSLNDKEEIVEVSGVSLGRELAIFKKASINKAAFVDMYKVDTVSTNGKIVRLVHKAIAAKANVRSLIIDFDANEEVSKIEVIKANDSAISKINQTLIYEPNVGYRIESNQDITMIDPNLLKVEVKF